MKKLFTLVLMIISFNGYCDQVGFSISEADSVEIYSNNVVFTKITPTEEYDFGFKYKLTPKSIYGIDTSDLDIIGGYILFGKNYPEDKPKIKSLSLFIKGKPDFNKLLSRIDDSEFTKDILEKKEVSYEKGDGYYYRLNYRNTIVMLVYNPFLNSSQFVIKSI